MKKLIAFIIGLGFFLGAVLSLEAYRFVKTGYESPGVEKVFEVQRGQSFAQIARRLQQDGLVSSAERFRIYGRLTGLATQVKVGEYALSSKMSPAEILALLQTGKSISRAVTFPEGSNIYEIGKILETHGIISEADFVKMAHDQKLIKELLGENFISLEGYLFPETYMVTKYTKPEELVRSMVRRFLEVWAQISNQRDESSISMNRHQVIILASVIEKETGAPEERPRIASVFHNRLKKKMKLQSDPTIIYGLWEERGERTQNIRKGDILSNTRFNTYVVPGIPAGPIANPGREAIMATLDPEDTEYLFFVSKNDGTHVFTKTYEDHKKAVAQFQLNSAARKGKSWRDMKPKAEK